MCYVLCSQRKVFSTLHIPTLHRTRGKGPVLHVDRSRACYLKRVPRLSGRAAEVLTISLVGAFTGSWIHALFLPIGLCYLVGLICFTALGSSERQEFA